MNYFHYNDITKVMKQMNFDLSNFDKYREDNRLEVKAANGGLPGSLWNTYSSFANTYGGCIICGVSEKKDGSWKTTGLRDLPKLKKALWDTIHNKAKVSHCLITEKNVEEYTVGEDVILVINVPRASRSQKPVYLNNDVFGATFRRDNEGDYHCTEAEVRAMIRDSSDETPDERVLDRKIDFDKDSIKSYRTRYNIRHEGSAWTELSDEDFLIQIGAADDEGDTIRPTAAGLLMFGKERKITKVYPEYFLDYREHMDTNTRWTDRVYSQEPEWSGNVFDFFNRVSMKLVLDLKKPFKLVDQVRIDETPVHNAVREALVNCLVNADFYQGWSVVIEKYPDRIVMANPGTIITGKKQMLKGGISQPRNKGLFKMFNLIGYGEHAGSGVPDIYKAWRDEGLQLPTVEELFGEGNPDRTVLTLPLLSVKNVNTLDSTLDSLDSAETIQAQKTDYPERVEKLLSLIESEPKITQTEMAERLKWNIPVVKYYIRKLKEKGLLERIGTSQKGHWIVLR